MIAFVEIELEKAKTNNEKVWTRNTHSFTLLAYHETQLN